MHELSIRRRDAKRGLKKSATTEDPRNWERREKAGRARTTEEAEEIRKLGTTLLNVCGQARQSSSRDQAMAGPVWGRRRATLLASQDLTIY
jgi:hypothetical protein